MLPVLCVGDHLSGEVHQRHISYLMPLRSHPDSLCSVQACHHDDPIDRSQFFIGKKHEYNQPFTHTQQKVRLKDVCLTGIALSGHSMHGAHAIVVSAMVLRFIVCHPY